MTTLLFIAFVVVFCKGVKSGCRHISRSKVKTTAQAVPTVSKSLAALEALQAQRDLINEQIRDIDEQLDYCPPAKLRAQCINRKTVLLGKLATCESKISRLCYGA